jgi:hypothetical protein
MATYRVKLARTCWFEATVEADSEDQAYEIAENAAPELSAQDTGWGSAEPEWSQDADDWMSLEDFWGRAYRPQEHGLTVELIDGEPADSDD